ncbi:MAG: hypothetical protein QOD67_4537, partial [Caballeronia sp.]|jgi:hypothetical protein|nr:hypothetical protein [Caballeronia sp.]
LLSATPIGSWFHQLVSKSHDRSLRLADFHLCINAANHAHLINNADFSQRKSYLVYNPVETEHSEPLIARPDEQAHFMYVGRLIYDGQRAYASLSARWLMFPETGSHRSSVTARIGKDCWRLPRSCRSMTELSGRDGRTTLGNRLHPFRLSYLHRSPRDFRRSSPRLCQGASRASALTARGRWISCRKA